ncbi:hypothetical protein ACWKWC_00910 [Geodermatophilus nigrescens]
MHTSRFITAALLLLAGCSSPVTGTAAPAGGEPFTEVLGRIDLADVDDQLDLYDVAATPDGGFVALLTGNLGTANRPGGALVELLPGDDGLAVGRVTEGAPYAGDGAGGELHVADDGTVVALGPVLSGDGSDDEAWDLALTVLAPGGKTADVVRIAADPDLGTPDRGTGVLSADGETLYAGLEWEGDGESTHRLAAVDVATGEVLASADLQLDGSAPPDADELALRPGGGVAALVHGAADGVVLAEYHADLRPVREPVEVVPGESATGYGLQVLADGTAVVSVGVTGDRADALLVTLQDGEVRDAHAVPGVATELVVDRAERVAYLGHSRAEGGAAVATVDLGTGEVLADVVLCEGLGSAADVALAADGSTLAATAECPGEGSSRLSWLLG